VASAGWSGGDITCLIDELEVGSYNMTILAYDSSGNSNSDTVIVTVISTGPDPGTTDPMIFFVITGGIGIVVLVIVVALRKRQ
jgi:hypothetical protein